MKIFENISQYRSKIDLMSHKKILQRGYVYLTDAKGNVVDVNKKRGVDSNVYICTADLRIPAIVDYESQSRSKKLDWLNLELKLNPL